MPRQLPPLEREPLTLEPQQALEPPTPVPQVLAREEALLEPQRALEREPLTLAPEQALAWELLTRALEPAPLTLGPRRALQREPEAVLAPQQAPERESVELGQERP